MEQNIAAVPLIPFFLMHIPLINYEYPPIGGGAATATAAIAEEGINKVYDAMMRESLP